MRFRIGRQIVESSPRLSDRLVGYFDPRAGLERLKARVMLDATTGTARGGFGGYLGGRRDRRMTRNWRPQEGSANADIVPDLTDLRARSRDLVRNVPIATGAVATTVTNVVGEGLSVSPSVDRTLLGLSDEEAEEWEQAASKEWALWRATADFTRSQTFEEMQDLALRSVLESGDVFVVRRYRQDAGGVYGTKIQFVEADRVSNPHRMADKVGMIGGVAFDADGVATGYSISDRHPGDFLVNRGAMNWNTVRSRDDSGEPMVLHLFARLRPDQARGVPFLAPVVEHLKKLGDYAEAEATAAVISAFFTVFITSQTGEDEKPVIGETVSGNNDELELGAGAVIDLNPGEKPEFVNPIRPNAQFNPFVMAILRQIGVALELPYELLIKHFTASYSASRAALETAWQFFRRRRTWLARRFCQPCYEWAITEAVATGRLAAPGFFSDPLVRAAWLGATWNGPARISLDQQKDAKADEAYLNMRVVSRQEIARSRFGTDIEQTFDQLAEEKRDLEAAGLAPEPPPQAPPGQSAAAEPDDDDTEDDAADGSDEEQEDAA